MGWAPPRLGCGSPWRRSNEGLRVDVVDTVVAVDDVAVECVFGTTTKMRPRERAWLSSVPAGSRPGLRLNWEFSFLKAMFWSCNKSLPLYLGDSLKHGFC